jgi:site-specific DNA-methyltransferase (adenine-specific)
VDAFYATHDGYSIDWLLSNPSLQVNFHDACRDAGLIGNPTDWNRELLRLRKSGAFPKRGEIKRIHFPSDEIDTYGFAAEIAWRLTSERFGGASLDEIYCDPEWARYFDRTAQRYAPGFSPVNYRWSALHLRKACKELVDDMKKFHFIFRTREFGRALNWQRCDFDRFMGKSGIYALLADDKSHLFLDRTQDIGKRLLQHSSCRAINKSIRYLSTIPSDDLPGPEYQDGLKVDLVRRYGPQFNLTIAGLFEALAT